MSAVVRSTSSRTTSWPLGAAFHIDLNGLRRTIHEAQNGTLQDDSNPDNRIYANHDGGMATAAENPDFSRATLVDTDTLFSYAPGPASRSVKHQRRDRPPGLARTTKAENISFSAPTAVRMSSAKRDRYEEAIARVRMPENTRRIQSGDDVGWGYQFTNDIGDIYTMFMCYEPTSGTYRVYLLEPRLEGLVDPNDCHVNHDGSLCLRHSEHGAGMPTMEGSYARSVLWSLGCSCYLRGYGFQFNKGQAY